MNIVIKENKLTDELKEKCKNMLEKVKSMSLKERREYYSKIEALIQELSDNKSQNLDFNLKEDKDKHKFDHCYVKFEHGIDKETEDVINELFKILTNKID